LADKKTCIYPILKNSLIRKFIQKNIIVLLPKEACSNIMYLLANMEKIKIVSDKKESLVYQQVWKGLYGYSIDETKNQKMKNLLRPHKAKKHTHKR